jgi:hypothetical protein
MRCTRLPRRWRCSSTTRHEPARQRGSRFAAAKSGLLEGLDRQLDRDLVPDHRAAAVERQLRPDSEVLAAEHNRLRRTRLLSGRPALTGKLVGSIWSLPDHSASLLLSVDTIREVSLPGGGRIELCVGDITAMTAGDGCDVLVVSAFPGDYLHATWASPSVIRDLANRGVLVAELGAKPEIDLRTTTSCWLSRAMPPGRSFGFDRLLCFEPTTPQTAASTVGDIFRTLVPFVGPEVGIRDVAMPIVASGNMRVPREEMLTAILTAARTVDGVRPTIGSAANRDARLQTR